MYMYLSIHSPVNVFSHDHMIHVYFSEKECSVVFLFSPLWQPRYIDLVHFAVTLRFPTSSTKPLSALADTSQSVSQSHTITTNHLHSWQNIFFLYHWRRSGPFQPLVHIHSHYTAANPGSIHHKFRLSLSLNQSNLWCNHTLESSRRDDSNE